MNRINAILNQICPCFRANRANRDNSQSKKQSQKKSRSNINQKDQPMPPSANDMIYQQSQKIQQKDKEQGLNQKRQIVENKKLAQMDNLSKSSSNVKKIQQNYIDQNESAQCIYKNKKSKEKLIEDYDLPDVNAMKSMKISQKSQKFKDQSVIKNQQILKKKDKSIEKNDQSSVNATSLLTSRNKTIKNQTTQTGSQIKSKSLIDLLQQSNFQISCQPSKRNTATTQHSDNKKTQQSNIKKTIKSKDGDDFKFTIGQEKKQYTKKSNLSFFYQVQIYGKERSRKRRKFVAKIFQKNQMSQQSQQALFYQKMINIYPQHKTNLINILKRFQTQNKDVNDQKKWQGIIMQQGQKTLSQYLNEKLQEKFSLSQYKNYMRQVELITFSILNGLKQMLDLGFIHKDIKPQNVVLMFNQQGKIEQVKIIDFGTVCQIDQNNYEKQRKFQGTFYYMAPQLLTKSSIQVKKLDSFSLGQVMYQMLLGKNQTFFKQIRRRQQRQKPDVLKLLKQIYQNQKKYQRYKKRLVDLIPTMFLPNSLIFTCIKLIELKKQDRFTIEQAHKLMNTQSFQIIIRQQIQNLKISQNSISQQPVNQIYELMIGIRTNLLNQQEKILFNFFLYLHMMTYYNFEKKKHQKKYKDLEKQLQLSNSQFKQYMECYLCYSLLKSNMFFQQKYFYLSWDHFYPYHQHIRLNNQTIRIERLKMQFKIPPSIKSFLNQMLYSKRSVEYLFYQVISKCYLNLDHKSTKQCLKNYLKTLIVIKKQQQNYLVDLLYIQSLRNFCTLILKSCKNSSQHYLQSKANLDQLFNHYKSQTVLLKEEVFKFLYEYIE